jgi:hypothetical protein
LTLPAASNKTIYAGDGATTSFPVQFQFLDAVLGSDIQVYLADPAGAMYGPGQANPLPAGFAVNVGAKTVTYPSVGAPLAVGWQLILLRVEALAQVLSLSDTGPLSLKTIETTFDKVFAVLQQIQEQLNRAPLLPINTPDNNLSPVISPTSSVLVTHSDTYANLKTIAAANPTVKFWGWATDQSQLYLYTGLPAIGDAGFINA